MKAGRTWYPVQPSTVHTCFNERWWSSLTASKTDRKKQANNYLNRNVCTSSLCWSQKNLILLEEIKPQFQWDWDQRRQPLTMLVSRKEIDIVETSVFSSILLTPGWIPSPFFTFYSHSFWSLEWNSWSKLASKIS